MGIPCLPLYGNADAGSAIQDIKKIVEKIETNKFGQKDLIDLYNANGELLKAVVSNAYEN